jgi:protein SHQ1
MPVTPRFSLDQCEEYVYLTIFVPHIRVSSADIRVADDGLGVDFFCKPYLLHLRLPAGCPVRGEEVDDRCKAVYDPAREDGTLTIHLPKCAVGQHFPDLDLLSALMRPRLNLGGSKAASSGSGIEVLSSTDVLGVGHEPGQEGEDEDEGENLARELDRVLLGAPTYGFQSSYSHYFKDLREELGDIVDLPDPDGTPAQSRRQLRALQEQKDFDPERYLGDLAHGEEDPLYIEAMAAPLPAPAVAPLSEEDQEELIRLPRKEILPVDTGSKQVLLMGLGDILCGYSYDRRTTGGESTVESAWTIATLSATLGWLEVWRPERDSAGTVILTFLRRALCYPFLRRWDLALLCVRDAATILQNGKRSALSAMLCIHKIMQGSETRYLLNKLFITDYCIWLQDSRLEDSDLAKVGEDMLSCLELVSKSHLGLRVPEWEAHFHKKNSSSSSDSDSSSSDGSCSSSSEERESDNDDTAGTDGSIVSSNLLIEVLS